MKDVVAFCKSTTTDLPTQIKEVDASIKTKIQPTKYTELSKALQENQEIRKRQLQQRKIKKFNHLKYKNNHHVPLREGRQQEGPNQTNDYRNKTNDRSQSRNRYSKPSYASVLKNKSNTDQRRSNNNNNGNNNYNRNNVHNNNNFKPEMSKSKIWKSKFVNYETNGTTLLLIQKTGEAPLRLGHTPLKPEPTCQQKTSCPLSKVP